MQLIRHLGQRSVPRDRSELLDDVGLNHAFPPRFQYSTERRFLLRGTETAVNVSARTDKRVFYAENSL